MKYNLGYRNLQQSSTVEHGPIVLGIQMYDDPSPMTARGTRALVDCFYALQDGRLGVGVGGAAAGAGTTTLVPPGPKKTKSIFPKVLA